MEPQATNNEILEAVNAGFQHVEERFQKIDERFEQIDRRFDKLEGKTSVLINVLHEKGALTEEEKRRVVA